MEQSLERVLCLTQVTDQAQSVLQSFAQILLLKQELLPNEKQMAEF